MLAAFVMLCSFLVPCHGVLAQEAKPDEVAKKREAAPDPVRALGRPAAHRFWDKSNVALFAGVGASRALDFASTRHFRARGVSEGLLTNDIVDNLPAFAAIEAAAAAASVGVSYWFHRTGHHRLERWVSLVHIGVTVAGAGRNYATGGPSRTSLGQPVP
jgi:hypothetical protein